MIIKTKYVVLLALILSAVMVCFIVLKTDFKTKTEDIEILVYKTNNGYGYSISYKNKLLIKQNNIPSIQRGHSFCNFKDAQKVANLVREKLYKKENPKITLQELQTLNIQLNCVN